MEYAILIEGKCVQGMTPVTSEEEAVKEIYAHHKDCIESSDMYKDIIKRGITLYSESLHTARTRAKHIILSHIADALHNGESDFGVKNISITYSDEYKKLHRKRN